MTVFSSFRSIHARLFTSFLFSTVIVRTANAAEGCKPQSVGTQGFDMSLYHYPFDDASSSSCYSNYYQSSEFQHGGYETFGGGLFGTATDIDDVTLDLKLNVHCKEVMGGLPENFHYGDTMSVSNFTMLLTGYFYAQESGHYTFNLVADDLAYLSFGAGNAFECCDEEGTVSDPEAFDLIVIWKADNNMSGSVSYNLEAGVYYPIRLLYANRDYHGTLELSFEDPHGDVHTNFDDHIYQFKDEPEGCPNNIHTSTTQWTGSFTSTFSTTVYTTTGSDGHATTETLYIVETPDPNTYVTTATTEYTQGTASGTTTYSTATGVTTGSDGVITTETTFFVETPDPNTYVTTATTDYTQGTADVTTTYSTATGVATGSDGVITTETTFFVETPVSTSATATATTIYTHGTASVTTTYSTATGVITGSDGIITTETTFYVEEPGPKTTITTAETTTIYTSVTVPTTVTHVTTYYTTDDEGEEEEIVETDIDVELPSVDETTTIVKTTTEFGSVTAPTTVTHVTTYYTTDDEGDEEEVVETDIEIELPSVDETVTTTSTFYTPGDVTVTTTISTFVTTYYTTDSEGNEEEVIETDYLVETPGTPNTEEEKTTISTTIISYYTGSETSTYSTSIRTYTSTDEYGNPEEVVETDYYVEIPEPTTSANEVEVAETAVVTTVIKTTTNKPAVTETTSKKPAVSEYPVQSASSTTANVSEYNGIGAIASNNILTFVVGLLFATFMI